MTDTTKTPRTRRELRDALAAESFKAYEAHNKAERELRTTTTRAEAAEYALDSLGFERSPDAELSLALGLILPHEVWGRKADAPELMEVSSHLSVIEEVSGEVQAATRRETLTAVIDALEITGYLTFVHVDENRLGGKVREARHDTDRFWSDLNTALDVRAEKKAAEERAVAAEKVAGLAAPQQMTFFFPKDSFDAAAPRASDLAFSSAFARDLSGRWHVGFDPAEPAEAAAAPTAPEDQSVDDRVREVFEGLVPMITQAFQDGEEFGRAMEQLVVNRQKQGSTAPAKKKSGVAIPEEARPEKDPVGGTRSVLEPLHPKRTKKKSGGKK